MASRRIIYVVNYNKDYLLSFVRLACTKSDAFFLFFGYPDEVLNSKVHELGRVLFWKDYSCAQMLTSKIKPHKVVFFELETLNQIALNTVCKTSKITTEFCDHGYQDYQTSEIANQYSEKKSILARLTELAKSTSTRGIQAILNNRRFFNRTIQEESSLEGASFLREYKKIRLSHSILDTRKKIKSHFANPDSLICFSPSNKSFYDSLFNDDSIPTVYTGYPDFDQLHDCLPKKSYSSKKALFIDQPYVQHGLYGWTKEKKHQFLESLSNQCQQYGFTLSIKPHPREVDFWNANSSFHLIDDENFNSFSAKVTLIIGYNSTLLFPFATNPYVQVRILNNHPSGHSVSDFLIKKGVAKWFNFTELGEWNKTKKALDQRTVKDILYMMDGAAGNRLTNAILKINTT